jgi:hypothetical protein
MGTNSNSELVFYQTEDGRTHNQCRFENETLWFFTHAQFAELFQTSLPNINIHLKNIYEKGDFSEDAAIKSYLIVRQEGSDGNRAGRG